MIRDSIKIAVDFCNLTDTQAEQTMMEIMAGETTPAQIACFLTAMRMKGETVDEITGFTRAMRANSIKVYAKSTDIIDTCGTGGDKLDTFNVSTTTMFVIAGAGCKVAKHGNRAASSKCGSADVLEALGVNLELDASRVAMCIDNTGIGFMYAPTLHPAMRHAVGPRKEIGIRTVFNILGPLTNPAGAKYQVIGVFSENLTEIMAGALSSLGTKRAMVFHGLAGLDELSTLGDTKITEVNNGELNTYMLKPEDVGLERASAEMLSAGDGGIIDNVRSLLGVLDGEKGAKRDIVLLNAAAALIVAGKAKDFEEGIILAEKSIDSGKAMSALERFKRTTQELATK